MTENIVTGKKYRILTDATQDIWDRISFWTKASDVYYDDNSNAEANRPIGILKRGTAYVVGTVAYEITAPSWVMLKCTTAGTTAASTPSTYKTISSSGTVITDGTAKFTVYDIRPTTTLSTNAYSVPTVSLLNTQISNIKYKRITNGNVPISTPITISNLYSYEEIVVKTWNSGSGWGHTMSFMPNLEHIHGGYMSQSASTYAAPDYWMYDYVYINAATGELKITANGANGRVSDLISVFGRLG